MSPSLLTPGFDERAAIRRLAAAVGDELAARPPRAPVVLLHVCGTHEHEIARCGLRSLLPPEVRLLAGPGCPVCVTPAAAVLQAVAIARRHDAIVATYGDMVNTPAGDTTLAQERARGLTLEVVPGPAEALALAQRCASRPVVFLSPGFETTAAPLAALLAGGLPDNLFVLPVHRLIPPALAALLATGRLAAQGLILPGHVLTVMGLADYSFLQEQFGLPAVVTGFEAVDILAAVLWLLKRRGRAPALQNLYPRSVRAEGNPRARALIGEQFVTVDAEWRGIGRLPRSGLALAPAGWRHDAARALPAPAPEVPALAPGCRCGDVLLGAIEPRGCPLFAVVCRPECAIGPCMVSEDGACHAAWTWRRLESHSP